MRTLRVPSAPGESNKIEAMTTPSAAQSFYWYDLETSGTDPRWHRIIQFAGIRTDARLNEVGDEYCAYVKLPRDVLPDPMAALVTGLAPQHVNRVGIDELHAVDEIERRFQTPGTCVAGYNSLRFDDEFIRYTLYRQLRDPYAREWQHGNSRWDLIDLMRATAALRPEGIDWPMDDGLPVFRLEALASANNVEHGQAHDALSDVRATIGLARLVQASQPRLFDYYLSLRAKAAVMALLRPERPEIRVHVSGMLPRDRRCVAPIMPLAHHPRNRNSVIAIDLNSNIEPLLSMKPERLAEWLFSPYANDADPSQRPRLKEIRANRCPFIAPLSVLRRQDRTRLGWDTAEIDARFNRLQRANVRDKVRAIYASRPDIDPAVSDVDEALYGGFVGEADRLACQRIVAALRAGEPASLPTFNDRRLGELLFRLRARCGDAHLGPDELTRWHRYVRAKLTASDVKWLTLTSFRAALEEARREPAGQQAPALLAELARHADDVEAWLAREPEFAA
jgi:exodeoxyribonuclease I